jgi:hypothetical protein
MDYLLHAFTLARSQRVEIDRMYYAERAGIVMLPPARLDFFVPFASMEFTDRLIRAGYDTTKRFLATGGHLKQRRGSGGPIAPEGASG